ncbi:ATP-binding protein [Romeria aff. gracilis LEGE 07310]|uniref:ATP-binding protein n=1 Tax=Vasconcelosia minhoensis LEGE 07310 TaxID=915328 RepID=A0A8J7AJG9_9CYAN|nr:anti-sigma regulatory factor [Romeria gracilis]MBE9076515.1 ATP-binding protein [Romeria aff. gracilis LEGE 07310]
MKTELIVPSDLKFLSVVENWLLESLKLEVNEKVDWSEIEKGLRLVIVEVYSNTVRHAHQGKTEIPVLFRIELKDQNLSLEIWDQGEGFSLEEYVPPEPTNFQEGGYGWLILHRIMDTVEYRLRVGGEQNCLRMGKELVPRVSYPR